MIKIIIFVDHIKQPLACRHQTLERGICPALRRFLCFHRYPDTFTYDLIREKIHFTARIWRPGTVTELFMDRVGKFLCHRVFAVHNENSLKRRAECSHPFQKAVHIRMPADAVQTLDPRMDFDGFPEEFYILLSFQQSPSQGAVGLIPYKQDRTLRTPEIVFEVMADAASIAHS